MGRRQKNANPSPIRRPGSIAQERLDKALQQNRIQMQRLIRSPSFVVDETVTEALSDDTQHALDTSELEQTILSRSQCSSSGSSSSTENHMPNDPPQLTNAPPPTNGIQQPIILPAAHKRCLLESTHPSDVHNYCVKPQGPLPNSNLQQTPPNNTFVLRTPSRTDIGPTHTEHIHASNSPFLYQRALSEGTVAKRRLVLDSPEYNSVNQTPKAKRFILSSNSRIGCRVNQDQAKSGDSSLVLLTKKFVELLRSSPNGIVNLNDATSSLGIAKRRLYDITNVLEGVELIRKNSKNKIQWTGFESSSFFSSSLGRFDEIDNAIIKQTLIDQQNEETRLDAQIEELKSYLNQSENQYIRPFTYVNYSDVSRIASFTDKTVIAIKAPATASVNVADPKHCFLMSVKSDSEPIHAFHCSNASTSNGTFRNRSINDAPVATRDPLMESPSRGLMTIFRDLSTSFYSPVKQEPMDLSLVHLESPLNKLNSKISNIKEDHKQTDYNFPYTDFPTPLDPPVIEDPAFSFSLESHEGVSDIFDINTESLFHL